MKKKTILSSVFAVVLCLCMIAGSTFALFTSTSSVNVAVGTGYVDVLAKLDATSLKVWSRLETIDDSTDNVFANGGTATISTDSGKLTIERMTPGDNVQVGINLTNNSDIAVKYRVVLTAEAGANTMLLDLLDGEIDVAGTVYDLHGGTSPWMALDENALKTPMLVTLSLPDTVGNEAMGAMADFYVTVEAVQADGIIDTPALLEKALLAAKPGDTFDVAAGNYGTLTLDGSYKDLTLSFDPDSDIFIEIVDGAVLDNVTFEGLELEDYKGPSSYAGAVNVRAGSKVDISFVNCSFAPLAGYSGVRVYEPTAKIDFIDCSFTGGRYAVYDSGAPIAKAVFTNCEFSAQSSWAVQFNGSGTESVLAFNDCTFDGCMGGIVKVLGAPAANSTFEFNNNVVENSQGHDGKETEWFSISASYAITVSGNTLDGIAWEPAAAQGLGK